MAVIGEIREAVDLLTEFLGDMRELVETLKDGGAYLRKHHPEAREDMAQLLDQMRKTVTGLLIASRVLTEFQFTVEGLGLDHEPARFNENLRLFRERTDTLNDEIRDLKGSCELVGQLFQSLSRRAGNQPWYALLGDRGGQRARDLAPKMQMLYQSDLAMIGQVNAVLFATQAALRAVQESLLNNRGAAPENVPAAAAILKQQASAFAPYEIQLEALRDEMDDLVTQFD